MQDREERNTHGSSVNGIYEFSKVIEFGMKDFL